MLFRDVLFLLCQKDGYCRSVASVDLCYQATEGFSRISEVCHRAAPHCKGTGKASVQRGPLPPQTPHQSSVSGKEEGE